MCETLDISCEELWQRFTGGCFDGKYIHLNIRKQFSESLNLFVEFMDDSNSHGAAHRLELAWLVAKVGKIDHQGLVIVPKCEFLIELDSVLQHIMAHFRFDHDHTKLHNIALEKNETFLELNLFSETQFVEFSHRTYDHFVHILHKLKQDEQI